MEETDTVITAALPNSDASQTLVVTVGIQIRQQL